MKRWLFLLCCAFVMGRANADTVSVADGPSGVSTLRAMASAPMRSLALRLGETFPFKANRAAFDQAFSSCRQALKANPQDVGVRTNLGALYLYRDQFHPEESGNLEKAINQFLIVLRDDPGNPIALSYFREYDLLVRLRPTLANQGVDRVLAALQAAWEDSRSEEGLWTLARADLFAGHLAEARAAIEKLVGISGRASSHLLLGVLELKSDHAAQALAAFQAAKRETGGPTEMALAKLGAAQALTSLGRLEEADDELGEASAGLPSAALARAARSAGMLTPNELGWELGKASANAGEVDRAVGFIGTAVTEILIERADKAWHDGDNATAVDTYLKLLELEPEQGEAFLAIGLLSFDLHRYNDVVWAFNEAGNHDQRLSKNMLVKLGVSYLTLANYAKAYDAFDKAHHEDGNDSDIRAWRIAAAFGAGGWKRALDTLQNAPPLNSPPRDFNEERLRTYDIVYGVILDAERRAKEAGLRYPLLSHLSLHNELLSTVANWSFGGLDRTALRKEKWDILWEAIDLYRALPLKPRPPSRAVAQEAIAEEGIRQGHIGYEVEQAAIAALEIAPWWPEARYNLGVYARDSYLSVNLASLYSFSGSDVWDNNRSATQEFIFYLHLAPQGPRAAEVRKQLKQWGAVAPPP